MRRKLGILTIILGLAVLVGVGTGVYLASVYQSLPPVSDLEVFRPEVITRVFSRDGKLIGEFFRERRVVLASRDIPQQFRSAILSAEDHDFYKHWGADALGIVRAAIVNVIAGRVKQGGSTITQQLAKTLFLTPERTYDRKIKEFLLSVGIESKYSKDEILTMYINQIYYGHGAYGAETAARRYFNKPLQNCTLPEIALLAGIIKAPALFSPVNHPDAALARRNQVLDLMAKYGEISEAEAEVAKAEPLTAASPPPKEKNAAYFVEEVRQEATELVGSHTLFTAGLTIRTTLDFRLQEAAVDACSSGLAEYERRHPPPEPAGTDRSAPDTRQPSAQVALLAMDPRTGDIVAMTGGRDFSISPFNRATQAKRQVGSSFKPVIYLAALDRGMTPATMMVDSPASYRNPYSKTVWAPKNYSGKYKGPVTLTEALRESINVVAIRLLDRVDVDNAIAMARNLGIESNLDQYLSLALGTSDISLVEMVRAYATVAAQGVRPAPRLIVSITADDGREIYSNPPALESTIDARSCYQLTAMMKEVIRAGTGKGANRLNRPLAGKTGTTDEFTNAWFIGFSPQLAAGVWVGFDRAKPLGQGETGGKTALPIWTQFMEAALAGLPADDFPVPEGIIFKRICLGSGAVARPGCPHQLDLPFKSENVPQAVCTLEH